MPWYIEFKEGPCKGRQVFLNMGETVVGRSATKSDLVVPGGDSTVSRAHAVLVVSSNAGNRGGAADGSSRPTSLAVGDNGSKFGTFVDKTQMDKGGKAEGAVALAPGQEPGQA